MVIVHYVGRGIFEERKIGAQWVFQEINRSNYLRSRRVKDILLHRTLSLKNRTS
jgi:hypothetical protein